MHMADALVSPAVGAAGWTVSLAILGYGCRKIQNDMDEKIVPLMGVLAAFVFAAQMVNFSIPATGSSGHLTGTLLLAVLLGPHAAFVSIASVLTIQAFFFADGGLLALGCNIFNLGFFTCYIVYPLVYKKIAGGASDRKLIALAAFVSAVIALQMGSFAVVTETVVSGMTDISFSSFLFLMQPIHLAIGAVEGAVTALILLFILQARPEMLSANQHSGSVYKPALAMLAAALITGGVVSIYASGNPDGLEWSLMNSTDSYEPLSNNGSVHKAAESIQSGVAVMPDYSFKDAPESGSYAAGIFGSIAVLAFVFFSAFFLKMIKRRAEN